MCKETDLYNHNFLYSGANCTGCGVNQLELGKAPEIDLDNIVARKPKTLFGEIHDYFPSIPAWKLGAYIKWLGKEFMVEALSTAKHDFTGTMRIKWFQKHCVDNLLKTWGTKTPWREQIKA